jgi:hypothetical protein
MSIAFMSCATTQHDGLSKEQRQEKKAALVKKKLDDKHFTIDINTMQPRRGPQQQLSFGWTVEVKGDSLISYLPYVGRAWNVPYGGGKGLNFTAPISQYYVSYPKQGLTRIDILSTNDEDNYEYLIEVFDNGSASVDVLSREREQISYTGELHIDK